MSRVQLALNVSNIGEAVAFYTKLFQNEPAKRREGYANFAVDSPPLKLVLVENPGAAGSLNHLGVEAFSTDEVTAAHARLSAGGLATATEEKVDCCYAVQDKVLVDDPDGARGRSTPSSPTATDPKTISAPSRSAGRAPAPPLTCPPTRTPSRPSKGDAQVELPAGGGLRLRRAASPGIGHNARAGMDPRPTRG